MPDFTPQQVVRVRATFLHYTANNTKAVVMIGSFPTEVTLGDIDPDYEPSAAQIDNLREAMDQIAPTGPDGSP